MLVKKERSRSMIQGEANSPVPVHLVKDLTNSPTGLIDLIQDRINRARYTCFSLRKKCLLASYRLNRFSTRFKYSALAQLKISVFEFPSEQSQEVTDWDESTSTSRKDLSVDPIFDGSKLSYFYARTRSLVCSHTFS